MNDHLNDLIGVRPPDDEIREAARRARLRAIERIEQPAPRPLPWLRFAAAAAALAVACLIILSGPQQPPAAPKPPAQPLRVTLTLNDGTKVVWTFDDRLSL